MDTLTLNQITENDIRAAVRLELASFFSANQIGTVQPDFDEIGGIDLAIEITGKAKPTIYGLVHARKIPHSKQGKQLYFSRRDLIEWLKSGKRKMQTELALEAENFPSNNSRQLKTTVAAR